MDPVTSARRTLETESASKTNRKLGVKSLRRLSIWTLLMVGIWSPNGTRHLRDSRLNTASAESASKIFLCRIPRRGGGSTVRTANPQHGCELPMPENVFLSLKCVKD